MRFPFLLAGLIVVLGTTAASTPAEALKIDHRSVGCATNGLNPAFTVRLTPTEAVDEARLYFEGEGTYMPYYVLLEKDGDLFRAHLPPVRAVPFEYWFWVRTHAGGVTETARLKVIPVADASACPAGMLVAAAGSDELPEIYSAATGTRVGVSRDHGQLPSPPVEILERLSERDQIAVAVIIGVANRSPAKWEYCIAFEGRSIEVRMEDPSPAAAEALRVAGLRFAPASTCFMSRRYALLTIEEFAPKGDRAHVRFDIESPLSNSGDGGTATCKRQGRLWRLHGAISIEATRN